MRVLDALRASQEMQELQETGARMVETTSADGRTLQLRRVVDAERMDTIQADGNAWEAWSDGQPIMRATLVELTWILDRMPGLDVDGWHPVVARVARERTATR